MVNKTDNNHWKNKIAQHLEALEIIADGRHVTQILYSTNYAH